MKVSLDVPEYTPEKGLTFQWEDDFTIGVRLADADTIVILANRAGLISLARQCLLLAQDAVPAGHHIHLDELAPLEAGSMSLILEKDEG